MPRAIESYIATIPPAEWEIIEAFVRASVNDADALTVRSARQLLVAAARHVHYCWTVGYPLDRLVIWRREVIAEFAQRGCPDMTVASRNTYRSTLFSMSDVLLAAPHRHPRPPSIGRGASSRPYTAKEVSLLIAWANFQRTENRRVNAMVLLCLGIGAGLSAAEIGWLRACDVRVDDEGVLLTISGPRARTVPMLEAWEQPIAQIAQASMRKSQRIFVPNRHSGANKSLISNFVVNTTDRPVSVTAQRLRATWLVTHLTAGTPVVLLARAAGLESLDGLSRFVEYVPNIDVVASRSRLRSVAPGRQYAEGESL